jgi:hypothetical protein
MDGALLRDGLLDALYEFYTLLGHGPQYAAEAHTRLQTVLLLAERWLTQYREHPEPLMTQREVYIQVLSLVRASQLALNSVPVREGQP